MNVTHYTAWFSSFVVLSWCFSSPLGAQEACRLDWTLEETLRVGSLDGDDALSFVPGIAIDPGTGDFYVPQRQGVLVFSDTGDLRRVVGREGSGPGEFEAGARAVTWANDELWVADAFRAQSFDSAGRPVDFVSFRAAMPHEGSFFVPEAPLADGSFWGRRWVTTMRGSPGSPTRVTLQRYDREGDPLDTIAVLDVRSRRIVTSPETGGFARHPLWSTLPPSAGPSLGDIVASDRASFILVDGAGGATNPDEFSLLRLSLTGDTLMHRSVPYEPVPISDEERDWWLEEFAASMAGDYTQGRAGYRQRDAAARNRERRRAGDLFWLPDHYPPVRRVMAGRDGTIWLLREFNVLEGRDPWEVYDRDGELIGRVEIDGGRGHVTPWISRVQILQASVEEVWATSTDEFEVPYIHRYRVDRGCGPEPSS